MNLKRPTLPSVVVAVAYVALISYPSMLAGEAPGEPVELWRIGCYAGAVAASVAVGALVSETWVVALPAVVGGALFWLDLAMVVVGAGSLFASTEFYLSLGLLVICEMAGVALGQYLSRHLRFKT